MAYSEIPVNIPRDSALGYPILRARNHPLAPETTQRVFVIYMDIKTPYISDDEFVAEGAWCMSFQASIILDSYSTKAVSK